MSMRARLIIIVLLFPLLTVSFLAIAPIRLASEPSMELLSLISPSDAATRRPVVENPHRWLREPPPAFTGTARTAEHVVVLDHMHWRATGIADPMRLDRSDAGAVTLIDGVPTIIRPAHDPAFLPEVSAAVLRGSEVFAIDPDGSGFAWVDENLEFVDRVRLAGPIVGLETSRERLWVVDALGFVYLFGGREATQTGELISLKHPSRESGEAVYGLSVHSDGRAAVVEGTDPARIKILDRSDAGIVTREVAVLDSSLIRPRHIAWASDDLLVETEDGIAKIDADSGAVTLRELAGRILGITWIEALDLILVLADSYDTDSQSRLYIVYTDDLSDVSTLVFPESAYSLSHDGNLVSIGLEDVVLLYEFTY